MTNGVVEKVEEEPPNAIIDEQDEGVIIVNDRRIQRLLEERNDEDFTAPAAMELVLLSSFICSLILRLKKINAKVMEYILLLFF